MSDELVNTIEVLAKRVASKEEEATKLKLLVNDLCRESGIDPRYPGVSSESQTLASLRTDQFYGKTLTAAIRDYLELRKSSGLGAASVGEIYKAIRDGGYKFETSNEANAKIGVGNALRKTSSIFHRLPNGNYGLLTWYPSAKTPPAESEDSGKPNRKKDSDKKKAAKGTDDETAQSANTITNEDIRDVVLAQTGEFKSSDIETALKAKFPAKTLPDAKIPTVIYILKTKKGLLRKITPSSGRTGATYVKI